MRAFCAASSAARVDFHGKLPQPASATEKTSANAGTAKSHLSLRAVRLDRRNRGGEKSGFGNMGKLYSEVCAGLVL